MELYIGGLSQGKLQYVLENTDFKWEDVFDYTSEPLESLNKGKVIWNHFHKWFQIQILNGNNPEEKVAKIIENYPNIIIISNEVGNGIVPIDAQEREYRERLGRCLCNIAKSANKVERIICKMGQRIK